MNKIFSIGSFINFQGNSYFIYDHILDLTFNSSLGVLIYGYKVINSEYKISTIKSYRDLEPGEPFNLKPILTSEDYKLRNIGKFIINYENINDSGE